MSRTNAGKLVLAAKSSGTAIGAFNVILLEHAEALVAGAEHAKLPIILQISENCVKYHKALKPISVATIAIAESASVPVSVHLDHSESEDLVKEALDLGYDSVMFDGSKLTYADNVAASARMASLCKSYGATLEVEIGEVGGKDGVHAPGVRTNPLEAKAFAEATGADLVAVAVGSSHAMTTRDATLDFDLIAEIARTVSVPLVLHGSSGVSDPDLQKADQKVAYLNQIVKYLEQVLRSITRTSKRTQANSKAERKAAEEEELIPEINDCAYSIGITGSFSPQTISVGIVINCSFSVIALELLNPRRVDMKAIFAFGNSILSMNPETIFSFTFLLADMTWNAFKAESVFGYNAAEM